MMQATRIKRRAEKVAEKMVETINKLPDAAELAPLVISNILVCYERYGLADLVEHGWNWKPKEDSDELV